MKEHPIFNNKSMKKLLDQIINQNLIEYLPTYSLKNQKPIRYPSIGRLKKMTDFVNKVKEHLADHEDIKDCHVDYTTDKVTFLYVNDHIPDLYYSWGCTMEFIEGLQDYNWFVDMIRNKWFNTWLELTLYQMDSHSLILLHMQKYQQLQQLDISNLKYRQNKRLIQLKIKYIDKEIHRRARLKDVSDRVFYQWYIKED